jgi:hypothetical protein
VSQQPLQRGNRVGFIPVVHEVDGLRHIARYRCLGGRLLEVYVEEQVRRTLLGAEDLEQRVRMLIEEIVRGDYRSPV